MNDFNIELTNYCISILGTVEGVKPEINKISDNSPKYMEAKGLLIAVFKSAMRINELNDYFKLNGRSFLIFVMGENNYGAHLNEKLNNFLFSGLIPDSEATKLVEFTKGNSINTSKTTKINKSESKIDYSQLNTVQKQQHIDKILDKISIKGIESLTNEEMEFLNKYN